MKTLGGKSIPNQSAQNAIIGRSMDNNFKIYLEDVKKRQRLLGIVISTKVTALITEYTERGKVFGNTVKVIKNATKETGVSETYKALEDYVIVAAIINNFNLLGFELKSKKDGKAYAIRYDFTNSEGVFVSNQYGFPLPNGTPTIIYNVEQLEKLTRRNNIYQNILEYFKERNYIIDKNNKIVLHEVANSQSKRTRTYKFSSCSTFVNFVFDSLNYVILSDTGLYVAVDQGADIILFTVSNEKSVE